MPISLKDKINKVYITSINTDELLSAYKEILSSYLENPTVKNFVKLNAEYQKEYSIYESLSYRLYTKYLLLKYSCSYTEKDKDTALSFIRGALDTAADKGYMKTAKILANARDFITDVHELVFNAAASIDRVRDSSGELATTNAALVREVYDVIKKALKDSKELTSYTLFPEDVVFPNLSGKLITDLEEECEWFKTALQSCADSVSLAIVKECISPLESAGCMTSAQYYESPIDSSKISAKTLIISSPFMDEAILFCGVFASAISQKIDIMHAERLEEYRTDGVNAELLFSSIADKGINLLIVGIEKLSDDFAKEVKLAILKASHKGSHFLVYDSIGGRAQYESFDKIAADEDGLSPLDVHHAFITMPSFSKVSRLLSERGYVTDSESSFEKIRNTLPFMGFIGLNTILSSATDSKWLEAAAARSDENTALALSYLDKLIAPRQLIDDGWGNFSGHIRFEKGSKKSFDYDDIHGIDKDNIKKIMEKPGISTFDRCGLVVKYCLLSGNDISVWKSFSDEEKSRRATMATRLVARILDTAYTPEVEIIPEEKWEDKGAGGLCKDGGKRIVYRSSSAESYSWMEDAVCHECFHAFQHTSINVPYAEWFFSELGVTEGRISTWNENFKVYVGDTSSTTYRVEIVECDARAFSLDCRRNIENYWKDIDFN